MDKKVNTSTLEEEVIKIFAKHFGGETEEISPETTINDLEGDSLDSLEIIMDLEEKFDIGVPDDVAERMLGVKDFVDYIKGVLQKPNHLP